VAFEVACTLHCPMDVIMVRKVGVPWQPEVAMGALGEDEVLVVEHATVKVSGIAGSEFQRVVVAERKELRRRVRTYRRFRSPLSLEHQAVVIVDDGLATGATAEAACAVARKRGATRVTVAAPVSSNAAANRMESIADEFVALARVGGPFAVGQWYEHFEPTSDQEVIDDLRRATWVENESAPPGSIDPGRSG